LFRSKARPWCASARPSSARARRRTPTTGPVWPESRAGFSPPPRSNRRVTIPFIDLLSQRRRIGATIDAALLEVAASGQYIMGPAVGAFEHALCDFGQAPHALSCSNGTDALVLLMMAWDVGPGDAVFCPAFTFAATAEVVALAGATPVFIDIRPDTWTIDPDHL